MRERRKRKRFSRERERRKRRNFGRVKEKEKGKEREALVVRGRDISQGLLCQAPAGVSEAEGVTRGRFREENEGRERKRIPTEK